ncbi:hypothetical protein [Rubellimicrobium roseum]|uniref:Uncharacterized protein n=1 Tax=Rubellimicrobium roseum TaxID=687525 RepID=A0A5C4NN50_9RHOB|nr:hypothetical protein [Rubellimicrobium roseum]TNC74878.1 hypothetical protein FHG71_01730 [Rubellimicrobium roseum]
MQGWPRVEPEQERLGRAAAAVVEKSAECLTMDQPVVRSVSLGAAMELGREKLVQRIGTEQGEHVRLKDQPVLAQSDVRDAVRAVCQQRGLVEDEVVPARSTVEQACAAVGKAVVARVAGDGVGEDRDPGPARNGGGAEMMSVLTMSCMVPLAWLVTRSEVRTSWPPTPRGSTLRTSIVPILPLRPVSVRSPAVPVTI